MAHGVLREYLLPHPSSAPPIIAAGGFLSKAIWGSQTCLEWVNIKCTLKRGACSLSSASFSAFQVGRAQSPFSLYLFFMISYNARQYVLKKRPKECFYILITVKLTNVFAA